MRSSNSFPIQDRFCFQIKLINIHFSTKIYIIKAGALNSGFIVHI
uniref:Uncharacterized protein n=1 Tax=virus sp. ctdtS1 TaxID=2826808 RepID=A0A8S5NGW6_9VIRU|nr:MAG TPA: hypothetical protein [virus sp. ctdtS1]DAQ71817.1 MAG TPA: hypothetical protein [Bacteriophage sp.]